MIKNLLLAAVLALTGVLGTVAQPAPYTDQADITPGTLTATWDVPAATYGPLLSLQGVGLASGATIAVNHLIAYGSASYVTNAVETAASGTALLVYPQGYVAPASVCTNTTLGTVITSTPVKPVWLVPGDKLVFTVSATNMSASAVVIRAGLPGK